MTEDELQAILDDIELELRIDAEKDRIREERQNEY